MRSRSPSPSRLPYKKRKSVRSPRNSPRRSASPKRSSPERIPIDMNSYRSFVEEIEAATKRRVKEKDDLFVKYEEINNKHRLDLERNNYDALTKEELFVLARQGLVTLVGDLSPSNSEIYQALRYLDSEIIGVNRAPKNIDFYRKLARNEKNVRKISLINFLEAVSKSYE